MSGVKETDPPELPVIFKAISSNSYALELVEQLNEVIAFGSPSLTRTQEKAIVTVVSAADHCCYEAPTHGATATPWGGRSHSGQKNKSPDLLSKDGAFFLSVIWI